MPAFPEDVSVGVVSHNGRQTLPRLFDCLAAAGAPDDRIRVYDVGSTDGTKEWLADAHPLVVVRRLEENVGPDPGRNWALRDATHPYLLLLDADAVAALLGSLVVAFIGVMIHPIILAVGVVLVIASIIGWMLEKH